MKDLFFLGVLAVAVAVSTASAQTAPSPDGGAPAGRYVYTSTSVTVTDTKTGLVWQRTPAGPMIQPTAKSYCAGVAASLGGTGWRLPTMKELMTLIDYAQTTYPMIDRAAFPATPPSSFWSSSLVAGSTTANAWAVSFAGGDTGANSKGITYSVQCVR